MDEEINRILYETKLVKVNNFYLTNYQIEVLRRAEINYETCSSLKDVIYKIEEILDTDDDEELELISMQIAEIDYYQNTNK